jgi:hypothetical protein
MLSIGTTVLGVDDVAQGNGILARGAGPADPDSVVLADT